MTPSKKISQGVSKNFTGGCEKISHNNINNNINNNIDNNINKKSKNEISKGKNSKIESKLNSIEKKCLEYDLKDEVIEPLSKFFRNLLENNKLVTDDKVNAILGKLAEVDEKTQLNAIHLSLDKGYMNIDPAWLRTSFKSKKDSSIYWGDDKPMTEEEEKEYFERLKRCKTF